MRPFVIVTDMRTGSTLLSTSLDAHGEVRCYGELFHPDDLPDIEIPSVDRRGASGSEVIRHAFSAEGVGAVGFRAMIFLPTPEQPQWADAWDCLRDRAGLRVIYLTRRDRIAQYASVRIAHQTRAYHPPSDDPILRPENRPSIVVEPEEFRRWVEERERLWRERRRQLEGKLSLELDYEALTGDWEVSIRRVQEFLGVSPLALPQQKRKQETRPLSEVIINYNELIGMGCA